MNGGDGYLKFALQDLVQAVVEDVEEQTDRLRQAVTFAKDVLALVEKGQTDDRRSSDRTADR